MAIALETVHSNVRNNECYYRDRQLILRCDKSRGAKTRPLNIGAECIGESRFVKSAARQ